ncbi:PaaI family thioesterase [Leucobacter sp. GX24907]
MTQQNLIPEPEGAGPDFLAWLGVGALAEKMNIEVTEFTRDRVVATMPVEGNTQPTGILHGGAHVVLGETLGSVHANYVAPEGYVGVGVDVNATHTAPAAAGVVTAVCTPIKLGRSMTVHEIVITGEDGRRCSTVRITNHYTRIRR